MKQIPKIRWVDRGGGIVAVLGLLFFMSTSLLAQSITLTSPNTNVVWQGNTVQNITWSGVGFSNVRIDLSTNNGSSWTQVGTQSLSSGTWPWTVTPVQGGSTQCLIRVSDVNNLGVFDISNTTFTIPPPIIVSYPNGGETLQGGQQYGIRWISDPSVTTVLIEYSTNNGANWTQIATNIQARQLFYPWTPPSVNNSSTLVRVTNTANTTIFDVSDAVCDLTTSTLRNTGKYFGGSFDGYTMSSTLPQAILLTSPNTAVTWLGNTYQQLSWTYTNVGQVLLEFSSNNGSSWNTITTTAASSNTYQWLVPPVQNGSTQCLVRVSDALNPSLNDISDVNFTVPPPITVLYPNGAEVFQNGVVYPIRWVSDPSVTTVLIEYSTNNGSNWTQVATTIQAAQGFYPWTPPSANVANALVRVSNSTNTTIFDVSNANFSISTATQRNLSKYFGGSFDGYSMKSSLLSAVQVTSPNTNVTWLGNTFQQVSWTYTNISQVLIEFSSNNGSSWNTVTTTSASSNSYQWLVPAVQGGSTQCLIKISDAQDLSLFDVSDVTFTVPPPITVLYPNGAETFQNGVVYPVRWVSDPSVTTVLIEYSTNNGSNWTQIATSIQAAQGFYPWTPPSANVANALVRVSNSTNTTIFDVSNANFSISTATQRNLSKYFGGSFDGYSMKSSLVSAVQVTSPNTNVTWLGNTFQQVSWTYTNISQVLIEFSSNNGSSWNTVTTTSASSNSYQWLVPAVQGGSTQCLIKISDAQDISLSDVSDVTFTVPPPITVLYPNGAETFQNGVVYPIRWVSDPSVSTVLIEYSTNNGTNWTQIATTIQAAQGFYPWTPPSANVANALVRVSNSTNTTIFDVSNANFSISTATQRNLSKYFGGAFDGYSMKSSLVSTVQVTSPNTNVTWLGNTFQQVSWTYTNISQVLIEFSSNNGSSWNIVTTTSASSNSYQWLVPAVQGGSTQCLIKISDAQDLNLFDISDITFTVPPPITVLYPNGAETFQNGVVYPVRWITDPSVTTVLIEYSTNNGTNWTQIATNIQAAQGFYPWTPPSVNASNSLVRVTNTANTTIFDVSDANFTITTAQQRNSNKYFGGSFDGYTMTSNQPQAILLTSPNTAVTWLGNTFQQLSWTYTNVGQVLLEFSTNNGSSWSVITTTAASSNTYQWLVPAVQGGSSQCLVRVSDALNTSLNDISDVNFTVPPPIVVVYPNGGESFQHALVYPIRWVSDPSVTTVLIEYSTNNGVNWTQIATNIQATQQFYPWTIPSVVTSNTLVRVTNTANSTIFDVSDQVFNLTNSTLVSANRYIGGSYDGYAMMQTFACPVPTATLSGSYSLCQSGSATLSVFFTGAAPWSFTWTDGTTSTPVSNVTQTPYVFTVSPTATTTYSVTTVTNSCGTGAGYLQSVVNVGTAPTASLTGTESLCTGGSTTLSFTLTGSGPWDLTWTDGLSSFTQTGINQSPYLVNLTPSQSRVYSPVSVFSGCSGSVSGSRTVNVGSAPTASLSGTQGMCQSGTANLSATLTGSGPWNLTYTDGNSNFTLTGLTGSTTLIPVTPSVQTTYSLVSVNSGCSGTVSGTAVVSVLPLPSASLSGNNTILLGQQTVLTVGLTGTQPFSITYTDGTNPFTQTGITANPYLLALSPTANVTYTLVSVTDNSCPGSVSGSAAIVVNSLPTAALSGSHTICSGQSAMLTVSLGGPGPWNITWTDGTNNTTQLGITSTTYMFSVSPSSTTTYTLVSVTNPLTGTVSGSGVVVVTPLTNITLSGNNTVTQGQSSNLSFALTGTSPWAFTYSDGTSNIPLSGITTSPFVVSVTPMQSTTYSLVSMTSGCPGSLTGTAVITVNIPPTATLSGSQSICAGQSAQLTVTFGGGPGPYDLTWTDGTNNQTQLGITSNPYLISLTPSLSTTYNLVSVSNVIPGTVSGTALVQVTAVPTAVTGLQAGTSGCTSLSWTWNSVNGATAYYVDAASDQNFTSMLPGWNNALLGNTTSLSLTGLIPAQTVFVRVRGFGVCGTSPDITGVSSTTLPLPGTISVTSPSNIQCSGFTSNWNASTNATGYELEVSTQSNFSTLLSGYNPLVLSNVQTQTVTGLNQNQTYYWRVRGTNSCGVGNNSTGMLTQTANLTDSFSVSSNSPLCTGVTLQLSTTGSYSGSSFSWSGPNGYNTTQQSSSRSNMTQSEAGQYSLTISAAGCSNAIYTATVVVNDSVHSVNKGGNTPLCSGETLTLTASSQVNNVLFSWNGPNGFSGTGSPVQINSITTAGTGTYTVHATSPGCNTIEDTVAITVTVVQPVVTGSNSPICEGSALYLTASPISGTQYLWTGPNAYSSSVQNPSRTNTNSTMSGQYTVTVTQPGCNPLSYTTSVVVSPNPISVQTTTNSPVCTGGILTLSATNMSGASIVWLGPNGYSSTQFVNSLSPASTIMSGQYSVTLSTTACSPVSRLLSVTVHPTLSVNAGSNSPVCSGGVLQLSSSVSPNSSYSWIGPNGFTSTQISPTIGSVNQNQNGIYTLVVTQSGCGTSSGTTSVSIGGSLVGISGGTSSPVCSGGTLQLSATNVSGVNYLWNGPSGYSSTNAIDSAQNVTTSGVYTLSVSSAGCGTNTLSFPVTINPSVVAVAGAVTNPVCGGDVLYLTGNLVQGGIYLWTGPNGFTSNRQNPSISSVSNVNSGIYTLQITQPGCGVSTATVNITVGTSISGMNAVSNSPVCVGNTLQMSTILRTGVTYQWSGPNGFTGDQNNVTISNVQQTTAGNYSLTLSSVGCSTQVYIVKVIVSNPGTIGASNNGPICGGGVLRFFGTGAGNYNYQWTGPNGFFSSSQNPSITNAHYSHSGDYSLIVTVPNCGSYSLTTSAQVGANLNGVQAFSNSPVCENNALNLSGTTIVGASYSWTGPNGFTSGVQFPTIGSPSFADAGVYSLTFSTPGCNPVTRMHTVSINPSLVSLPGSNSPICQGGAIYFSSNIIVNGSYSWSGPNGFVSTQSNPSLINAQPISSGTYTLTISQTGCGNAVGTTVVSIGSNPSNMTLSSNNPVCVGGTLNLSANNVGTGSVLWSGPDGSTSNQSVFVRTPVQLQHAGIYTAFLSSPGCNSQSRTIGVSVSNTVLSMGSNSPICQGSVLQLTASSIQGGIYTWTGPLSYQINQQNPTISNSQPTRSGIYTLSVNTPACGIISSTTSVTVGSTLGSIAITSNSPVCAGNNLNLTVTNRTGFTFNWIGPNGFTSTVAQPVVSPTVAQSAGRYTVIVSSAGCGSTTVQSNVLVVNDPASVTASGTSPVCRGSAIYFSSTAPGGSTYSWSGPLGFASTSASPARSNAQLTHAGVYTLNATVPGCGVVSATTTIVVNTCREGVFETAEEAEVIAELKEFSFEIYPNPTEGITRAKLSVGAGSESGDYQLTVMDVLGHVVLMSGKQVKSNGEITWDLDFSQLAKGVYLVKLSGVGVEEVERVVVR